MLDVTEMQLEQASQGKPVRLMDARRQTEFILLRADQFDQLSQASTVPEIETAYALLADLEPEDWDQLTDYDAGAGR